MAKGHHTKTTKLMQHCIIMLDKNAKPNESDKWATELDPEPKQLWMGAAGAEAKSFYMVKPEIWVPVTLRCPWGASELTYYGTSVVCRTCSLHNIFVFMVVRRGSLRLDPPNCEIWKYFFITFEFVKEKFNRCLPPWKMLLPPLVKIHYCPPWNKSFLRPSSFVCRAVVPNLSRLAATCRRELYFAAPSGEPIRFCFKVWWQFENVFLIVY